MTTYIKGYILIKEYPGSHRIGFYEPSMTGECSKYPEFWEPVRSDEEVGDVFAREIEKIKGEIGLLREKDLDIYDVWESPNNNLFLKITDKYSLAIGPKGFHDPRQHDLNGGLYVESNNVTPVKRIGGIIFE